MPPLCRVLRLTPALKTRFLYEELIERSVTIEFDGEPVRPDSIVVNGLDP
jgi:hypothetical protein